MWELKVECEKNYRNLHPGWYEYELVTKQRKRRIFFNQTTGQVSWDKPGCYEELKGGILADQMGLGKTVMSIALILSDLSLL